MGLGCLGHCRDLLVRQATAQPDHGVLAELVDRLGVPPDPQDHQLPLAFGDQALVEDEPAHQVEPLEELGVVAERPEDVEGTAVDGQRTGQGLGEFGIRDVVEVDRLDAGTGGAWCSHVGALGRGVLGRGITYRWDECRRSDGTDSPSCRCRRWWW